jgi:uncharacterized low-complexity protein
MMKKFGLMSLIASAMLFVAFGATTLSADEGMGKCGKKKEMKMEGKCGKKKEGKCGTKKEMKMEGKCGKKKEPKKAMKCGVGKCG